LAGEECQQSGFRFVLLFQTVAARRHDCAPFEISHQLLVIVAIDNWQTSDVLAHHFGDGVV